MTMTTLGESDRRTVAFQFVVLRTGQRQNNSSFFTPHVDNLSSKVGAFCGHNPALLPSHRSVESPTPYFVYDLNACVQSPIPPSSEDSKQNSVTVATSPWSELTARDFDNKLINGTLAVCFVGMSNCGKSHWSWQLRDHYGFNLLSVDRHIESGLEPILRADGHVGIEGLAAWMGFPTDDRFALNQATYLELEEQITGEASPSAGKNSVLDTTGSVVYLSKETRERLITNYLVVHLEAGDELLAVMTDNYFKTPKPVVWGDAFNRADGESPDDALRRCYPSLLKERRKKYAEMAHVTIPASVSLDRAMNTKKFIEELRSRL